MRIIYSYEGKRSSVDIDRPRIIIGRSKPGLVVDVDLSPDKTVSRPHASLYRGSGQFFIEDLGSTLGTLVNGQEIKGAGPRVIRSGDIVAIGSTTLQVELSDSEIANVDASVTPEGDITQTVDAAVRLFSSETVGADDVMRRVALLYDLPLQLGAESRIDVILQTIVKRLMPAIPRASGAALLVKDKTTGQLLLKGHLPAGRPAISLRLAHRAMDHREAFVWLRTQNADITAIAGEQDVQCAMYAPLLWKGDALGVLCVASRNTTEAFAGDDLRLLVAVAQHAALTIVQRSNEDELRANANLMTQLMMNFSPKVRERLLHYARTGRPQLGGQKSEVTILMSDIRGFTRLTADRETEDIVDMLNEYFSAMVDVVFRFGGTVDKFIGDAMLVVFGSPEPDPRQHENAIRSALLIQTAVRELSRRRNSEGKLTCEIGIGLHSGQVLHGFIGSLERMEFTVIGDAVNWTERYCAAAAGGEVLISPQLHQWLWRLVQTEPVTISTKHEGALLALRVKNVHALPSGTDLPPA